MTSSVQLNIVHYPKTPLPGTTQEQRTEALERIPPTPLKSTDIYETDNVGTAARNESDIYKATIYGPDLFTRQAMGISTMSERLISMPMPIV